VHKRDISDVVTSLGKSLPHGVSDLSQAVAVGDDCAAIADGDGYLLFAIEGFVEDFVQRMPWFAGYCGVMVNVSDIYAMGGRPIAVVDALWSRGMTPADAVLEGLAIASQRYAVPIVGGHSNNRSERGQLAVAILGRAKKLLSSFSARPGDDLVMAVDLRGEYQEPYPYWNASTQAPAERLRGDLELLPMLAESGLCDTAKDISMAGAIGTTLMMLDCSQVGATIRIEDVPRPAGITTDEALLRWLIAFPSYGFVLSVRPANTAVVLKHFQQRGLAAANIGHVTEHTQVVLQHHSETALLWDTGAQHFITAQKSLPHVEPAARLEYA
jgi:AIR synthase-related protein